MGKKIVIVQGNPDIREERYGHALVEAYKQGAKEGGHEVKVIKIAELEFPWVKSKEEFYQGTPPVVIKHAQEMLAWADHWIFCYPLWLGTMPALLKAFLEQTLRPDFAFTMKEQGQMAKKLLKGKTARIIVTMGMPAFFYHWFYRAHSLKSFERNILSFVGIGPIKASLIGMVEGMKPEARERWLTKVRQLGRKAQ